MSDLWVYEGDENGDDCGGHEMGCACQVGCSCERPATSADLLAAVRRGVESGTIKGKVYESGDEYGGLALLPRGVFLVIPVDVGEDR